MKIFFPLTMLAVFLLAGCKDDQPTKVDPPKETVTRLYVSNTGGRNIIVYDNANETSPAVTRTINSGLTEGVWADAGKNIIIHSGSKAVVAAPSPTVKIYANAGTVTGAAVPSSSFTDSVNLTNSREISYDAKNDVLYVANSSRRQLLVYTSASTLSGNVTPAHIVPLPGEVWGVFFDDANNRLFMAVDNGCDSVIVIKTPVTTNDFSAIEKKIMRLVTTGTGNKLRMHGMWYSSRLDVLYVTDVGSGNDNTIDGSVYVIESLNTVLNGDLSTPVTPTRTITGAATGLNNPTDVDADDRSGKEEIYVCEKAGRKILMFPQTAAGNIAPTRSITLTAPDQPEDIFLDIKSIKE